MAISLVNMTNISFQCLSFNELTPIQLYQIMAIRQEVFVVEQNCPYLDADGQDLEGWHLMGFDDDNELVAYIRFLPVDVSYENYASFGRVLTSKKVRGMGVGKLLMQKCMELIPTLFKTAPVKIGAQLYLKAFYESYGFKSVGEEYLEDGIPHVKMVLGGS